VKSFYEKEGQAVKNATSPWAKRLELPSYQIGEAARYAGLSPQTVAKWHSSEIADGVLSSRKARSALSYMQLIEVAVVAAFRKAGITLKKIHEARQYFGQQFESKYPFAEYRFKSDGKSLLLDYAQIDAMRGKDKLLESGGQFAWNAIFEGRLAEFDYDKISGIALRWHVGGRDSHVVIDPRISFGAPAVNGTPTWILRDRWKSGENTRLIADDFGLKENLILDALNFEGIDLGNPRKWAN
jgi:uncharacterized protein (DUF433 family)